VISTQKLPTVCDDESGADADGGRDELLYRQRAHLRQVRHRFLAAVVLPIGVGDERDRRIPGESLWDRAEVLRIPGQRTLQP
jgi:hypothetical protein